MPISTPGHVEATEHDSIVSDNEEGSAEVEENPAQCGIGGCHPRVLKKCASMPVFAGAQSLSILVSSTLMAYVLSQVTTLEKHFGFNSYQTGLIMAANDVGFLAIVLFVSFMAAKVHIPRTLGFFAILFGVSGITCALPYFLFGAPNPSSSNGDEINNISAVTSASPSRGFRGQMCDGVNHMPKNCNVLEVPASQSVEPGDAARAHAGTALVIIVVGMVLQGVAKAPRIPFTTVYVDTNVENVKTGFYMGIILSIGFIGPSLAFSLGGLFARIYVTLEDTDMNYRHPKWIGAWWLGYITFGCAACLVAIPLFCFPRRMRGGHQKKEPVTRPQPDSVNVHKRATELVKGFFTAMIRLWTNPVYMCVAMASCTKTFEAAGSASFITKYIENQFAFPTWKANMVLAGVLLGTGCLGTFAGGYFTKYRKMELMASLKFIIVLSIFYFICLVVPLFCKCQQPYLYNSPGPRASEETRIQGCLENCACDDGDYFPVCADDGRTFFSPCHAGCDSTANGIYVNCTCIEGGTAVAGTCDYGCAMFYPYLVVIGMLVLLNSLIAIPIFLVIIRAVEERDKALAVAFITFLTSAGGWMLGPIIFGKLIDSICIQWEQGCGEGGSGACRLYDNDDFRWKLIGIQGLFNAGALVLLFLGYIAGRRTRKPEKKVEKEEKKGEGEGEEKVEEKEEKGEEKVEEKEEDKAVEEQKKEKEEENAEEKEEKNKEEKEEEMAEEKDAKKEEEEKAEEKEEKKQVDSNKREAYDMTMTMGENDE